MLVKLYCYWRDWGLKYLFWFNYFI